MKPQDFTEDTVLHDQELKAFFHLFHRSGTCDSCGHTDFAVAVEQQDAPMLLHIVEHEGGLHPDQFIHFICNNCSRAYTFLRGRIVHWKLNGK